jgi:hypothetical protein
METAVADETATLAKTPASILRAANLESTGKLLTVVGVLLPVSGALTREIAFALNGNIPLGVGATLPIPQLAVFGALVTIPALLLGLFVGWALRHISPMTFPSLPQVRGVTKRRAVFNLVFFLLAVAVIGYFLLLVVAQVLDDATKSPSAMLSSVTGISIAAWASWKARSGEPIPFSRMIPAVLAISFTTALTTSFGPTTAGVSLANVTFESAPIADGPYSVLGEDGSTTWLLACSPDARAVRVQADKIALMQSVGYGPTPAPASWADFPGTGFVQRCP